MLRKSDLYGLEAEDVGDRPVEPGLLALVDVAPERCRKPVGERRRHVDADPLSRRSVHAGDYPHPRFHRQLHRPACGASRREGRHRRAATDFEE